MAGVLFLLFSQIFRFIVCALNQSQKCRKIGNPRILMVIYNSDKKCCLCLQKSLQHRASLIFICHLSCDKEIWFLESSTWSTWTRAMDA